MEKPQSPQSVTKTITSEITTCLECPHHLQINDPDPTDSFCRDDQAVLCTRVPNPKRDQTSKWTSDRAEWRSVTCSERPYRITKQLVKIPSWCPL